MSIFIPNFCHQKPTGKLYLSADHLNLVDGVLTLIGLDTIPANFADAIEDTVAHKITPGKQGFYDIKGQLVFTNVVVDKSYQVALALNGAIAPAFVRLHSRTTDDLVIQVCFHAFLVPTDYIDLRAASFSGDNTVDVSLGEFCTFLSVQRVR